MFAWVTHRSLASLERPVDHSPSLERPADLSSSLERPADLSSSLERPADLSPSLERPADYCLQSKITDLILSFQVPCGSMNILFASRIFCFCLVIGTYILPFFSVIYSSYLQTEISVTLSIGKNYILFPVKPLCWCYLATALNLLSSSSPTKLVYYTNRWLNLWIF